MAARKATSTKMGWPQRVEMNAAIIAAGMLADGKELSLRAIFKGDGSKSHRYESDQEANARVAQRAFDIALAISEAAYAHFDGPKADAAPVTNDEDIY